MFFNHKAGSKLCYFVDYYNFIESISCQSYELHNNYCLFRCWYISRHTLNYFWSILLSGNGKGDFTAKLTVTFHAFSNLTC